jgi:hypothetical protein
LDIWKAKKNTISEYPDHRLNRADPKGNMRKIINIVRQWYLMIVILNSSTEIGVRGISEFEKNLSIGKARLS